jgi:hypothetical protein
VRRRSWLAALVGLGTFAAALSLHSTVLTARESFPAESDLTYVPPANQLRWMSVGYREALADLLWIRALVFSGENIGKVDIAATDRFVIGITELSPRFKRAYIWGGITAVYGATGKITRDQVDRSMGIYRRGLERFPESHELLYPAGMLLTHQVASTEGYTDQEKEAYAAEGIMMIRKAAAFGADPLVRRYATTLVAEHGTDQLAIQFLESQLAQAEDEDHRRLLRRKLSQLAGSGAVQAIEATRAQFELERRREAPYLPDTIWAVIRSDAADAAVAATSPNPPAAP